MWEVLGLLGVLALWGLLGTSSWFVALLGTRPPRIGLLAFALAFAAGIGGGALIPALGYNDAGGFWVSLITAFAMGTFVCAGALQQADQLKKERS